MGDAHAERSWHLRGVIQPGDAAGRRHNRISGIITPSQTVGALYVGPVDGAAEPGPSRRADRGQYRRRRDLGAVVEILSVSYTDSLPGRAVRLKTASRCRHAINRIGFGYDTKNIVDLMRYLFPLPIPQRWRRG
jgi:hypothetical protein